MRLDAHRASVVAVECKSSDSCLTQSKPDVSDSTQSFTSNYEWRSTVSLLTCHLNRFIHAFGFHHMHSSHDRDRYVQIMWDNIQPGTENNFVLYGTNYVTHFEVPYDYGEC